MWSEKRLWKELAKAFERLAETDDPCESASFSNNDNFLFDGLCDGVLAAWRQGLISESVMNIARDKLEQFRIKTKRPELEYFWYHTKAGHANRIKFCLRQAELCGKQSKKKTVESSQ